MKRVHPGSRFNNNLLSQAYLYEEPILIKDLHIKKSRCNYYIPEKDEICGCGRAKKDHDKLAIEKFTNKQTLSKWNSKECTIEDTDTNSYGEIMFNNNKDLIAKFIRVGQNTPMNKMTDLLFNCWKLKQPKLLISVTGGAENFNMKPKLRDVFRKGLIKAALSTNAWITSGGSNVGVMKHVGEAISSSSLNPNEKIVVLGISNWCTVTNRENLLKKDFNNDNELFNYSITDKKPSKLKNNPLDPNHSHFILVDNSQLNKYGGEIEFRGKLEREIVSFGNKDLSKEAPVVVLVLEGGVNTISTVLSSVKNNSPCVFIEGSGRCADFFAYALSKLKEDTLRDPNFKLDQFLREDIEKRTKIIWPDKPSDEILENFEQILKYPHLLTVYRLDSNEQANDIDIAILRSLLKAKKDNYVAQLKLALTWNRVDIARNFIFTEEKLWEPGSLHNFMYSAIRDDRVEFVEIFLENGCEINQFLTYRRLLKLYNDIPNSSMFYKILIRNKRFRKKFDPNNVLFKFKEIGEAIQVLIDKLYLHNFCLKPLNQFSTSETKKLIEQTDEFGNVILDDKNFIKDPKNSVIDDYCKNANHEMFMYCVLTGKSDMAKLFWNSASVFYIKILKLLAQSFIDFLNNKNEISSGLIASKIFKSYSDVLAGDDDNYGELAVEYEKLSVDVLSTCFDSNQDDAQMVLLRPIPEFGDSTSLQIGASLNHKNFVSSSCYQFLLAKIWYGQIHVDTHWFSILISALLPLFAPFILDLDHDKYKLNIEELNKQTTKLKKNNQIKTNSIEMSPRDDPDLILNDFGSKLSYFRKIYYFFRSPFVKFLYNQIMFILFLILFSYVMLCDFYPIKHINEDNMEIGRDINWAEWALIGWVVVFALDEFRQFLKINTKFKISKFHKYFSDFWNWVQLGSILLFIVGIVLRFVPDMNAYLVARIVLCIDILLWFFRSLHGYSVIRSLGPKLVMIRRMLYELMIFLLIVIVFIFAYGISTQALMYHNQELDLSLLKNIFFPAYFVIGGEYFEREKLMEVDECINEKNITEILISDQYTQDDCPEAYGTKVSLGLLVGYLIMLNILLVNLLIAIFSNTYSEVESEADKIWKYQRYSLVYEYYNKPFLPTPLTFIYYLFELLRFLFYGLFGLCFDFIPRKAVMFWSANLSQSEANRLRSWESFIADELQTNKQFKIKETQEYKLDKNIERLESLNTKLELELNEMKQEFFSKLIDMDKKIESVINLISKSSSDLKPNIVQTKPRSQIADRIYYPNSEVYRLILPDEKKNWNIKYDSYSPKQYTDPEVLFSLLADIDLINKPTEFRPILNFNSFDKENGIDRRSCLGEYMIMNGLPLNPKGRQGISGRGSLLYWGPNHVYEIVLSKFKKNSLGEIVLDGAQKRIIEFLVCYENENYNFPSVSEQKDSNFLELIERKLLDEVFLSDKIDLKSLRSILKNPINVSSYYKESNLSTDNAWFEHTVINFHDQGDKIFSKINYKENYEWKEIEQKNLNLTTIQLHNLKRIIKLHQ